MSNTQLSTDEHTQLSGITPRATVLCALVGCAAMVVAFFIGATEGDRFRLFFHSYLVAYCFFLSISLGGLFFVAVQHATRAGWSVSLRRLAELIAANFPVLTVLFLPILLSVVFGSDALFVWNNPQKVESSELLQHKAPYLNREFFGIRALIYLTVWWVASRYYLRRSIEQDHSSDPNVTLRMEWYSPITLILFAVTVTFAAFDWLMSLTPEWFSTIFGVYYFAGSVVGIVATLILVSVWLQSTGRLTSCVTVEHYHDLGKLLFSFVIFWGYIAFSQYMLIWYANIPEETIWYLPRQSGFWKYVIILLLFGHLLIPFFGLLPRAVKRRKQLLAAWALWLLIMHWFDLYWLVMPSMGDSHAPGLLDLCCLLGVGGIWASGILYSATDVSLVATGDPRLSEALEFENF